MITITKIPALITLPDTNDHEIVIDNDIYGDGNTYTATMAFLSGTIRVSVGSEVDATSPDENASYEEGEKEIVEFRKNVHNIHLKGTAGAKVKFALQKS